MRYITKVWLLWADVAMEWNVCHGSDELVMLLFSDKEAMMRVMTVILSWYQRLLLCSSLRTKARDHCLVKEGEVGRKGSSGSENVRLR